MAFTWPMQLFPLEFHYRLSDVLYFLIYHVFGYRKNVVASNLRNSFPEKNDQERKDIERKFYRGFTDMFIETLYFTHLNIQKEKHRLKEVGYDKMQEYFDNGINVVIVAGHFGNWEFMQMLAHKSPDFGYFLYKKINNKVFDQFYRELRGRAARPLEMRQAFRQLMKDTNEGKQFACYFISDQRPIPEEIKHWVTFMNQETPVMLGTERIARKTKSAVFYLELSRIKRGMHQAKFDLIFEHAEETAEFEITDTFMQRLEQSIRNHPDQYLWTHKRWKYKRSNFKE